MVLHKDVDAIREAGRATQGVIVMRFKEEGDKVISLALAEREETAEVAQPETAEAETMEAETTETPEETQADQE